jgi:fumarate reductase subunit D
MAILLLCLLAPVGQNDASHTSRHFSSAFAHSVKAVLTVLLLKWSGLWTEVKLCHCSAHWTLTKNYLKTKKIFCMLNPWH